MKRSRLPLTALRSFEVAGRLQSFTLAAEELHISQAAVSRQVRELESLLGQPLFERGHRSVSLTPASEQLLSTLTRAFDDIGASLDRIRQDKPSRAVIVSAEPSFVSAWLVRNLSGFRKEAPDIDLVIDAEPRLVEFRTAGATVAVRHSADQSSWSRVESKHLADVRMIPVVAPHLLNDLSPVKHPLDLLQLPLLHEENRDLWQSWFTAAGIPTPAQRGTVYTDSGLVLQAALQGEGVALIDELFAKDDLRANRLYQPFDLSIAHGAYWLVARKFSELPDDTAVFVRWLEAQMHGDQKTRNRSNFL